MRRPPSMTVSLLVGATRVAVIGMVTTLPPQLNAMVPPWVTAAPSAANVQLSGVPVPTTLLGLEMSADCPSVGTPAAHEPFGLPALHGPTVPPPEPVEPLVVGPLVV